MPRPGGGRRGNSGGVAAARQPRPSKGCRRAPRLRRGDRRGDRRSCYSYRPGSATNVTAHPDTPYSRSRSANSLSVRAVMSARAPTWQARSSADSRSYVAQRIPVGFGTHPHTSPELGAPNRFRITAARRSIRSGVDPRPRSRRCAPAPPSAQRGSSASSPRVASVSTATAACLSAPRRSGRAPRGPGAAGPGRGLFSSPACTTPHRIGEEGAGGTTELRSLPAGSRVGPIRLPDATRRISGGLEARLHGFRQREIALPLRGDTRILPFRTMTDGSDDLSHQ